MTRQKALLPGLGRRLACGGFAAAVALAHGAAAQTMNANSASFNAGFGRTSGEENGPVNVQLAGANGVVTSVNGVIQASAAGGLFGEVRGAVGGFTGLGGALDSFSGAAGGASTTIIGDLDVVVQGGGSVAGSPNHNGESASAGAASGK
jgi:holdfast attachment protein HfaA